MVRIYLKEDLPLFLVGYLGHHQALLQSFWDDPVVHDGTVIYKQWTFNCVLQWNGILDELCRLVSNTPGLLLDPLCSVVMRGHGHVIILNYAVFAKSEMPHQFGDLVLRSTNAIVYLEYNPLLLPSKPLGNQDEKWSRFVCISDTHARTFNVPSGDVLLHSGDLTNLGKMSEFEKTTDWLCSLPHPVKMCVVSLSPALPFS